jgi:hypothetical protein
MYATKEENRLIKCSILYPMLLTILNRDLASIHHSSVKFSKPYEELIETTLDKISHRLHEVKKEMYNKNIRVTAKNTKLDDSVEYDVFVRGYHEVVHYSIYHLRNQSELWLCKLFIQNRDKGLTSTKEDVSYKSPSSP